MIWLFILCSNDLETTFVPANQSSSVLVNNAGLVVSEGIAIVKPKAANYFCFHNSNEHSEFALLQVSMNIIVRFDVCPNSLCVERNV